MREQKALACGCGNQRNSIHSWEIGGIGLGGTITLHACMNSVHAYIYCVELMNSSIKHHLGLFQSSRVMCTILAHEVEQL